MAQGGNNHQEQWLKQYLPLGLESKIITQILQSLQEGLLDDEQLRTLIPQLNHNQKRSLFSFLGHVTLEKLPQLNKTEVSLAERKQHLFSIFWHYIIHINPNETSDFSRFTENITLVYNKNPTLVEDLLGYRDLESLLVENYYNNNTTFINPWTKLRFLIHIRTENLDYLLNRQRQPIKGKDLQDLLAKMFLDPSWFFTLKHLQPAQLKLLLEKRMFPLDLPNYSCNLNNSARELIISIITENDLALTSLLLFIKQNLLGATWLNNFLKSDQTSEKSLSGLGGSEDKDKLLAKFSDAELQALAEELEATMAEDLAINPPDEDNLNNSEGGIALFAQEEEPETLATPNPQESNVPTTPAEKLRTFLLAWHPEILEEALKLLSQTIISELIDNPEMITRSSGLMILQMLVEMEFSSENLLFLIKSNYFKLLITKLVDSPEKKTIFNKILELLWSTQELAQNNSTKQQIVQILDSDFLQSVFLTYGKNPQLGSQFLQNFTLFFSNRLIMLDDLVDIKSRKFSFLQFVETISRLTEPQVQTIINQLQAFSNNQKNGCFLSYLLKWKI